MQPTATPEPRPATNGGSGPSAAVLTRQGHNGHRPDMHWPTMARVTATPTHPDSHPTDMSTDRVNGRHPDTPRHMSVDRHVAGATGRTATRRAVAALVLVNGLAVYGQLAYVYDHVAPTGWATPARVALSVAAATAFEAIALYVGWHAHDALLLKAHGTARRLRRASYLIAALVGAANYSHFADQMRPTAAAVMFGLVSLLSPWLWGLHTRRAQHLQLIRERRADDVGAEFSSVRRRNFPIRSYMAYRWSIDRGVTDPIEAWRGYNADRAARRQARQVPTRADRPMSVRSTDRVSTGAPTATPTPRQGVGRKAARPKRKATPRPMSVDTPATPPPAATTKPDSTPTVEHSAAAVANATELRRRYPDILPSDYKIRQATGWSPDRVKAARAAYTAGADRGVS